MILYPAIDLKDGQAVRLYKGEMDQATVFNDSPADQALAFEQAGCSWIHLVDLNGAFAGTPVNDASVREILSSVSVPCQLGGGIRDMATIAAWIELGLSRVILGTVAVENPALVREAAKAFPGKIAVGLDARRRSGGDPWLGHKNRYYGHRFGQTVRTGRYCRDYLYRH